MEKNLTKSYIRVNGSLWLSLIFMILMLINAASIKAVVSEKTFLDSGLILRYIKSHSIHIFLFISSIFLALSANKKLAIAHLALSVMILIEMIQAVFVQFDKFIIFNIFVFFTLCFYFYFILRNELNASYYVSNYSDDDLRDGYLVTLTGNFNERPELSMTLTNWDINGFFARCTKMPDTFDRIKVAYGDYEVVLEDLKVNLVNISRKEIGCMVNDVSWKKFVDKLSSLGIEPINLR
jgi:hypothetical protein